MENKKLKSRIKHGATPGSLKDISIVIIGFIMALGVFLSFITNEATTAGVTVDPTYNNTYTLLQADQARVQDNNNNMINDISNVSEAKAGDFAYFGLKSMLDVFKAPLGLLAIARDSFGVTASLFPFIPPTIVNGVLLILLIIVLMAGVRFLTSRNNDP